MDVLYWNGCGPSRETTVLPAFSHMDYFTGPTWHSPYCSDELHSWSLFFLGKILRYPEMHHIQLWPQRKEKKNLLSLLVSLQIQKMYSIKYFCVTRKCIIPNYGHIFFLKKLKGKKNPPVALAVFADPANVFCQIFLLVSILRWDPVVFWPSMTSKSNDCVFVRSSCFSLLLTNAVEVSAGWVTMLYQLSKANAAFKTEKMCEMRWSGCQENQGILDLHH